MADTGRRRNKYGGWFNVNEYMNNKLRDVKDYDDNEQQFKVENSNVLYENQSLSDNQKNAIREYTSEDGYGDHNIVNKFLNNEKQLNEQATQIVNNKIDQIQSAISQPLNKDIYVYRGINIKASDLKQGQVIENKGFTSASIYRYDASVHSLRNGPGVTIKLKVKKGTKALYIGNKTSAVRNEHEILFQKGHSIKIIKIDKLFDKDGDLMNYEVLGELN